MDNLISEDVGSSVCVRMCVCVCVYICVCVHRYVESDEKLQIEFVAIMDELGEAGMFDFLLARYVYEKSGWAKSPRLSSCHG